MQIQPTQMLWPCTIYPHPKQGLFNIHNGAWRKNGWVNNPTEYTIIGEDDQHYIYEFRQTDERHLTDSAGNWILNADGDFKTETGIFYMPLGIHKTRLIKWLPTQLKLI